MISDMIRAVQGALHIKVDGDAGSQTWTAIYTRVLDVPPGAITLSIQYMIGAVQAALNINEDDEAGTQTWTAIVAIMVPPAVQPSGPLPYPVIDINHYNDPLDLDRLWNDGVRVIFHKGSQGDRFHDPLYASRKQAAIAKGFKWGVYHFSGGQSVQSQLANLFSVEDGSDRTIAYALDFEHSTDGTADMTIAQAREFIQGLQARTGDAGWLYGSDMVREGLAGAPDAVLGQTKLWLADYSTNPSPAPSTWPDGYTLLQTKQGSFAGIAGCDLNVAPLGISDDALVSAWPYRA
jgi:GH25 family lysozyme M1 (1,4-beta-N-acetylmuramidase)